MTYKVGIGQDSHRFMTGVSSKECVLSGLIFDDAPGFQANSDGDVIIHAICNAISSVTGTPILGGIADDLCLKDGITDSSAYLQEALKTLEGDTIVHVAISLEGKRPKFFNRLGDMRANLAAMMGIDLSQVGITATSGESLTDFGRGDGVQCFAIVTVSSGDTRV